MISTEVKNLYLDSYHRSNFFIGGEWVKPNSKNLIEIISPSTEEIIGQVPDANSLDIDLAVKAASSAFAAKSGWSSWSVTDRANLMRKFASILELKHQELSVLYAHELGRPFKPTFSRPSRPAELLMYYANLAEQIELDQMRPIPSLQNPGSVKRTSVKLESRGVTAVIVPFNGTLEMGMFKIGPTLALGGTVVLKPSPQSPLEGYIFAEAAIEAGFPAGVINVLPGSREAGEALVANKKVGIVGFTGSTATGKAIAKTCADSFTPTVLELGGKSAAVLLDDVDITTFSKNLPYLGFTFTGQNCFIHSRIIVTKNRYAEVMDAICESVARIKVGDPFEDETQNGPLISQAHREKVESYIQSGIIEGAHIAFGGNRPKDLDKGWYLNPTIFADATNQMRISREEIFGPVISVIRAENDQDAVAIANDSEFGLAGSVWANDETHAREVADQMDIGSVGINCFGFNTAAPFGGRKNSGIGTELGIEGFLAYSKYKSTHYSH
ncbi:MAG: aldehyde dehydrogenase family protein [Candidatus Planktophila sp.]|nr:aldehyde dehydrogenase family protein [Candidatus Planktophila sp.]